MTQWKKFCYWKLGLAISLVIGNIFASENCTLAQILPDGTLGTEGSVVKPNVDIDGNPITQIDGGARQGTNLFHSFKDFKIGEEQRVYFSNPNGIDNILSRVTGGSRSEILGKLGVLGNANLFLINPNGVIFGPNASLDLAGSFVASTASSLNFADGTQFSATATQTSPLLTVSVPIGLQFGGTAAGIRVQEAGLRVQSGKTLGLVGGEVTLEGGFLQAPGGRIELGSVASNSLVSLNPTLKSWSLGYEGVQNYQNIQLIQGSSNGLAFQVSTSGNGGGNIQVQGRQVMLADGSLISSINQGPEPGGKLTVTASESVHLLGTAALTTETIAAGDAGDITINTGRLLLSDRAFVSTQSSENQESSEQTTLGTGQGGDLTVNASKSVELINSFLSSSALALGDAGDITINTRRFLVSSGAQVSALTFGKGQGGNLTVNASDSVELSDENSRLASVTEAAGNAGDVKIATGNLVVQGAEVNVSSAGTGDAGNLEATAGSILLDDGGKLTATSTSGKGGGNISLDDLNLLLMRGNSEISTDAEAGLGSGGNINIDTNLLIALENSDITANASEGKGGNIQIMTQGLFLLDSEITAKSERGIDGMIEINRPETEISSGLVFLPTELVDISELIAQGCSVGGGNTARESSKFVATGRGGLPPTPTEALRSDPALADLGTPVQGDRASATISTNPTTPQPDSIIEAQGWIIGPQGEVVLTAQAPSVTPHIPWLPHTSCNGF